MKSSTASRLAVFLILLIVGQEVCVARYIAQDSPLQNLDHSVEKREAEEEENREETGLAVRSSRQKRGVGLVVLAVTVSVSAAGLGFEIYNKIKGCCGLYPAACNDRDEVLKIKGRLEIESRAVDAIALKAVNRKEDVIHANYKLQELWTEMDRIGEYEVKIIELLASDVIKGMNNKWFEIEQQLKAKNSTVIGWSYLDIDTQFHSYLDDVKTALIGLSSFMGYGLTAISYASFNYYKRSTLEKNIMKLSTGESYKQMVNARHTKSAKVIGVSEVGINNYIKETATARVNSKFGGSKYTNILNGMNIVASAISIGFEIYGAIEKIKYCKDRASKVHDSLLEIKKAETLMKVAKQNATDYYNLVDQQGWKFISDQLTNATFQATLLELKQLAEGVSTSTPGVTDAVTKIDKFVKNINSSASNATTTALLMDDLTSGLGNIKFFLKCIVEKGKLLNFMSEQCKNGTNSLANLYSEGTNSFGVNKKGCLIDDKGTPYTSFDAAKAAISRRATAEGYNIDCILNNGDKKDKACRLSREGYSNEDISKKMQITEAQVAYFTKNCPEPELTPSQKSNICTWRGYGMSDEVIVTFLPGVKLSTVKAYVCPTTPAS